MFRNCKDEFLSHIEGKDLLCCRITRDDDFYDLDKSDEFLLPVGFSDEQYQSFLESLDWRYDFGFGCQEVYGFIWYKDGTWSERLVYDGAENWVHKTCPKIPLELYQK